MKTFDSIYYIFDKMEDSVRARLSRHPFIYTFIGGSAVVLFWRGVWHSADYLEHSSPIGSVIFSPVGCIILAIVTLLLTGLFVSVFIGDSIIMSGIKHDKKIIEKTLADEEMEKGDIEKVLAAIVSMKNELETLEHKARSRCDQG
jgi:uncharacterized protein YneF (UPF0154 family)